MTQQFSSRRFTRTDIDKVVDDEGNEVTGELAERVIQHVQLGQSVRYHFPVEGDE